MLWVYIRLYILFLFRTMLTTMGVEIAFYLIYGIKYILGHTNDSISSDDVHLIAFGVGVLLSLQTNYIVDGRRGRVWSDTFGFDPDKYKEEEEDEKEDGK